MPAEGDLLPETYHYSWGDTRERMLARQRRAMTDALAELWDKRACRPAARGRRRKRVILASIVEKETGVAEERPRIAAVFVNRLKRGMRLQADPTVIYGLTQGKAPLDRRAVARRSRDASPLQHLRDRGLPPTPIANPGRAAIAAVLNPVASEDLYFVADGTGGHVFAATLADHNRNVARLRQVERDRANPR